MKLRLATLLPVGLFVVMGAVLALGLRHDPKVLPSMLLDRPVPVFDLPSIDSGTGLKSAEIKGPGLTLINVFASWCVSCREEHPLLMRVSKDPRLKVVGLDWKDTNADAGKYLATYGNPYAQIGADTSGRAGIDLGISGVPETFAIDAQGHVKLRVPGPLTPEIWDSQIEPLIKQAGQAS